MGADRAARSPATVEPMTVIAVHNPGDGARGTPAHPTQLAVPVELLAAGAHASGAPAAAPEVLHVRCAGCNLVVQFPLLPEVQRHGIVCSACSTVSYPNVDGHLDGSGPAEASGFADARREGRPGGSPTSPVVALMAMSRVTKWFALLHVLIVIVDALAGDLALLLGPYRALGLLFLGAPACGYVSASRMEPYGVLVYLAFCLLIVAYHVWVMFATMDLWKLLLLLFELYMGRVVLRFGRWLLALGKSPAPPGSEHPNALADLRAGRVSYVPW